MRDLNEKVTKRWVLALTSIGSFMAMLDAMVVATALNAIRQDLGASIESLQWTMNAYNLSFAVLLLTGAALGDRLGRRRVFVFGIALFVAASAACALANSVGWLIAARVVQGAGAALVMPLAMALLSASFPPAERAKALGVFASITGLALIVGPVLGGLIVEGIAWQWIFWLNVPIGLVVIPIAWRRIPESVGPGSAIDVAGVLLVTGASLGLVWALTRGNAAGWNSTEVVVAFVVGSLLAVGFVIWELRSDQPMIPMRFFAARAFTSGIVASFLFYGAMYALIFFLPQFFQSAQSQNPLGAGLRMLPLTATLFVVAPIAGNLVRRVGERRLVVVGLLLQATGIAWIEIIASPTLAFIQLIVPLLVTGAGISMAMPAVQNAILNSVDKSEVGKASGVFNMFRFLGGVSGVAIAVAAFTGSGSYASAQTFNAGFVSAIGVAAILSLLGSIAGVWQPSRLKTAIGSANAKA
jgi:EmrB/QacA subfamily drug resistance transporter